jgi:hypothetical protein
MNEPPAPDGLGMPASQPVAPAPPPFRFPPLEECVEVIAKKMRVNDSGYPVRSRPYKKPGSAQISKKFAKAFASKPLNPKLYGKIVVKLK